MCAGVLDKDKEYGGRRGTVFLGTAGVYGFDHVCFGVHHLRDAASLVHSQLGGIPHEGGTNTGFEGCDWTFPNNGKLEALSPAGSTSFLHRFLAKSGPSIHHVTFMVNDLRKARKAAEEMKFPVVGYDEEHPSWKEFFLFPKDALGIVVQLAEQEIEAGAEASTGGAMWRTNYPFPETEKPSKQRSVDILGIRLSCQETEVKRCIEQWGTLLGGVYEDTKGAHGRELHFRYPGSPMYIKVNITTNKKQPTGPIGVEICRRADDQAGPLNLAGVLGRWFVDLTPKTSKL